MKRGNRWLADRLGGALDIVGEIASRPHRVCAGYILLIFAADNAKWGICVPLVLWE
jgi:hypothetical protein